MLQLLLDLFAPPVPVQAPEASNFDKKSRLAQTGIALAAPKNIATSPPEPPALAGLGVAPAVFRHPQAKRELRLGDALVGYALARARRRTIGFSVGPEGLAVRAPHAVTIGAIEAALQERSGWILRKLVEARERAARQAGVQIAWRDGVQLPYLGGALCVRLDAAAPTAGRLQPPVPGMLQALHLGLPVGASPQQLRDATAAWLGRRAREHFAARLDHFAPLMGVRWQRLSLTNARTRWGSARSDGSIRLNWRLMHVAPDVLDYVVVHELAHLRVMDHSPRFWAEVAAVLPDYVRLRQRLQAAAVPRWEAD